MQAQSVFDLPPVVMKKVTRVELLDMLRPLINRGYMPSATGDRRTNRKPEYLRHQHPAITDKPWPNISVSSVVTGFFAFDTYSCPRIGDEIVPVPKSMYFYLDLNPIYVMIDLSDDDVRVALAQNAPLHYVPWGDEEIAIDRFKLQEELDTYV